MDPICFLCPHAPSPSSVKFDTEGFALCPLCNMRLSFVDDAAAYLERLQNSPEFQRLHRHSTQRLQPRLRLGDWVAGSVGILCSGLGLVILFGILFAVGITIFNAVFG